MWSKRPRRSVQRLHHRADEVQANWWSPSIYSFSCVWFSSAAVMELSAGRRGHFEHWSTSPRRACSSTRAAARRDRPRLLRPAEVRKRAMRARLRPRRDSEPGTLSRVDVLVAGEQVDALSLIAHRDAAYGAASSSWSAAQGDPAPDVRRPDPGGDRLGVIARETVKAKRKNVLAKCYGGDISASASCSRSRRRARSG